jgi:hypothetical protein
MKVNYKKILYDKLEKLDKEYKFKKMELENNYSFNKLNIYSKLNTLARKQRSTILKNLKDNNIILK